MVATTHEKEFCFFFIQQKQSCVMMRYFSSTQISIYQKYIKSLDKHCESDIVIIIWWVVVVSFELHAFELKSEIKVADL